MTSSMLDTTYYCLMQEIRVFVDIQLIHVDMKFMLQHVTYYFNITCNLFMEILTCMGVQVSH